MNYRPVVSFRHPVVFELATCLILLPLLQMPVCSQDAVVSPAAPPGLPPAATTTPGTIANAGAGGNSASESIATEEAPISESRLRQAAGLISEALTVAQRNPRASLAAVRGAASLLPRLEAGNRRSALTSNWIRLAFSPTVPRSVRMEAMADFFDVAARRDLAFARMTAGALNDPTARAGAYVRLSEVVERQNWLRADEYANMALAAARQERNGAYRARALTYVADRIATLNPATRSAAVREATGQVRALSNANERDYLTATLVGAASKFDLPLARRMAGQIWNPKLKTLATSRVNLALVSQTTLVAPPPERISALASTATRHDTRAIPVLLQLPAQPDVLGAISRALPPIYPTAAPSLDISLLERVWNFAGAAEPSVQRDELQSRLARLMVLHDPWRGRGWGKLLAWRGGRVQVGAFLHNVMEARRSALRAAPLQDLAERSINRAIVQARSLPPVDRVPALLMIAGQILG